MKSLILKSLQNNYGMMIFENTHLVAICKQFSVSIFYCNILFYRGVI